jgi:hypothetical protein
VSKVRESESRTLRQIPHRAKFFLFPFWNLRNLLAI